VIKPFKKRIVESKTCPTCGTTLTEFKTVGKTNYRCPKCNKLVDLKKVA
jgi:tRNA(Ile2) C34 agmatinyltransferase TiaS